MGGTYNGLCGTRHNGFDGRELETERLVRVTEVGQPDGKPRASRLLDLPPKPRHRASSRPYTGSPCDWSSTVRRSDGNQFEQAVQRFILEQVAGIEREEFGGHDFPVAREYVHELFHARQRVGPEPTVNR